MNGLTLVSAAVIPAQEDLDWQVAGVADFDGDGKADIFWRHKTTGENVVWLMSGVTRLAAGSLYSVSDTTWEVKGIGDFNGDGRADVMWRRNTTGENSLWLMNGLTVTGGLYLLPVADLNWEPAGTGDFDGDGMSDILWRHKITGQNSVWLMNGTGLRQGAFLPTMPTTFEAVGPGPLPPPSPDPCSYSITPGVANFVYYGGGPGTINIARTSGACSWQASSDQTWASITSSASGNGAGTVTYNVLGNLSVFGTVGRVARITVSWTGGSVEHLVDQIGVDPIVHPCNWALSIYGQRSVTVPSAGGTFPVVASFFSPMPCLISSSGVTGSFLTWPGSGSVTVDPNPSPGTPRTGTLFIRFGASDVSQVWITQQ